MNLRLDRRLINPLLLVLTLLALFFLLQRYYRLRDAYYEEYLRYKEVMLLLKNYQTRQKVSIDENFIRSELSKVGADFFSLKQLETGYELKAKNLRGENLPRLIYSLEQAGVEIVKLKAVDNTGQGLYELEALIR
ncbi:MAG: hypothetical protein D6674_08105 [Acidobacteria bacterium]|jgi:hypothetical protein|nr:MAG: hypothetical protein D6674_08105 [Acidobacteriota bacterium]